MIDFVTVNNLRLRYFFLDNHKPENFLFLPGWGGDLKTWQKFLEELAIDAPFNIYFLELPGFGESDLPPEAWRVADYAACVKAAVIKLGLNKFSLFGHSFGGSIAVYLTCHEPEMVGKLFLSGPAIIRNSKKPIHLPNFLRALLRYKILATLRKKIYSAFFASTDYAVLDNPIMKQTFINVTSEDGQEWFKKIIQPVEMFWGRQDNLTPLEQGLTLKTILPHAELIILEEARHGLHLQQAEELRKLIKEKFQALSAKLTPAEIWQQTAEINKETN